MLDLIAFLPWGFGVAQALCALYWLALALPGFALLRRLCPAVLENGVPSAIALSYLASFVLFSPISVLGYALHAPLGILSAAIVLAVLLAAGWLFRVRASLRFERPPALALVALAIVLLDMLLGLRAGSNFGGDAAYHMARVRMLLDHGFNSWDPLVAGGRFDAVYHTNLYHALIAASAQLARTTAPAAWAFAWFWTKLVCAGAIYQLTLSVFGERFVAWVAFAAFAVWMSANSTLAYPNALTAFWLLPLALAFFVELHGQARRAWPLIGLAATAWIMPQVHALYYVFACMMIAPLAAIDALRARAHGGKRELLHVALALALGAPWLGVTLWYRTHDAGPVPAHAAVAHPAPIDPEHAPVSLAAQAKGKHYRERGMIQLSGGGFVVDPREMLDPREQQLPMLFALAFGLWRGQRRDQLRVMAGVTAIALAVMYVPPLCSAFVRAMGAVWIARRLGVVPDVVAFVVLPGVFLAILPVTNARAWQFGGLALALLYAEYAGVDAGAFARASYVERAIEGLPLYQGLRSRARRRAFFDRNVPPGAEIVMPLERTGELPIDCDCYPLALGFDLVAHGMTDLGQRRADVIALLDPEADPRKRIALLRYWRVQTIYVRGNTRAAAVERAYRPWLVTSDRYNKERILTLDPRR